ncbi:hypothetical protein C8R44DRAFT_795401 [Mycena epipterygia]|nr:hypothetical protein C8R44DRAFT_795401 [Mycena epipterygia]
MSRARSPAVVRGAALIPAWKGVLACGTYSAFFLPTRRVSLACSPAVVWCVAAISASEGFWCAVAWGALCRFPRPPFACGVIATGGWRVYAARGLLRLALARHYGAWALQLELELIETLAQLSPPQYVKILVAQNKYDVCMNV